MIYARQMHIWVCTLLAAGPAVGEQLAIDELIAKTVVVDGCVNVYSPGKTIGQPDFESVKRTTGINIGSMTCGSEGSLQEQVRRATKEWKGVRLIRTTNDIDLCLKDKQYGLLLYSQTHPPLHGGTAAVKRWHAAGLRILNLQYGQTDPKERLGTASRLEGGLTPLGRKVVAEAFRLHLIVDLSHCNEQTTLEAAAMALKQRIPVIQNHTAARDVKDAEGRKFANYKRIASDKELRAVAATGGVSCIMCYRPYLRRRGTATTDDYVEHVMHAIRVAGIDHVGISTDGYLDGSMARAQTADGIMDSPRRWFEIAKRLRRRGLTDDQIRKVYGGNLLRVYRKVLR